MKIEVVMNTEDDIPTGSPDLHCEPDLTLNNVVMPLSDYYSFDAKAIAEVMMRKDPLETEEQHAKRVAEGNPFLEGDIITEPWTA